MDNLQYGLASVAMEIIDEGFKPYYKWIIFNILSSKKNIDFMLV